MFYLKKRGAKQLILLLSLGKQTLFLLAFIERNSALILAIMRKYVWRYTKFSILKFRFLIKFRKSIEFQPLAYYI